MTADVEFVKGEGGEVLDIPLVDADGNVLDTSGYTAGTMTWKSLDESSTIRSISVTIPSNGTARWTMTTSDTNVTPGFMAGQIELTGPGLVKKTFRFDVYCETSFT